LIEFFERNQSAGYATFSISPIHQKSP